MPLGKKPDGFTIPLFVTTIVCISFVYFTFDSPKNVVRSVPPPNPRVELTLEEGNMRNIEQSPLGSDSLRGRNDYLPPTKKVHFNSTDFDIEETSSGPILRVHHMIEKSQQQSTTCIAFGDGLRHATVGETAKFTIKVTNSSLIKRSLFSALAVGDNHMFVADPLPFTKGSTEFSFSYTPTMEGEYNFYVEQLRGFNGEQYQISGSPFRLIIQGPKVNEEEKRAFADSLPSCQTVSHKNITWAEGSWVTRKLAGPKHGVLRSGWVFQPKICSFDIFTHEEIAIAAASSEQKTVVILGTSTDRGVFVSLVDLVLSATEKVNLKASDIAKCWGFAELQVGSLRIIYQDFRISRTNVSYIQGEKITTITCHNEKKVSQGHNFFDDALAFLQEFLFSDRLWPDVIFVRVHDLLQVKSIFEKIPLSWKGVMYPTNSFKIKWGDFYTADGIQQHKDLAQKYPSIDERIQILDAFGLSSAVRHGSESSPLVLGSNHFHRSCNELDGEMKICGDATEIVAQLLLGKAIAPKGKDIWMKSILDKDLEAVRNIEKREITVCHDCPLSLLPFHIKRIPDLKCYRSTQGLRPAEGKNFKVWNGTLCPNDCMKTKPVGQAQTQSGPVDVRECVVPLA